MFYISKIVSADELINVYIQNKNRAAAASIRTIKTWGRDVSITLTLRQVHLKFFLLSLWISTGIFWVRIMRLYFKERGYLRHGGKEDKNTTTIASHLQVHLQVWYYTNKYVITYQTKYLLSSHAAWSPGQTLNAMLYQQLLYTCICGVHVM